METCQTGKISTAPPFSTTHCTQNMISESIEGSATLRKRVTRGRESMKEREIGERESGWEEFQMQRNEGL